MVSREQNEFYRKRRDRLERAISKGSDTYQRRILRGSRRMLRRRRYPYQRYQYRMSWGGAIILAIFMFIIFILTKIIEPNIYFITLAIFIYFLIVAFDLGGPHVRKTKL